jgi:protein phosphatase
MSKHQPAFQGDIMAAPVAETDVRFVKPADLDTGRFPPTPPALLLKSHGQTDRGGRRRNEDQFVIAHLEKVLRIKQSSFPQPALQRSPDNATLFIVADGVGGAPGGDEASALAIGTIEQFMLDTLKWFFQLRGDEEHTLLQEFQQALGHADARLLSESQARPRLQGMSTTVTMAFLQENRLFVAHAGDSRCYLLRDRVLLRLTRDHNMVEEMVDRGYLKPEEAENHPFRNVLTNSLGGNSPGVRTDVHKASLQAGDLLLLCTDGLVKAIPEANIKTLLDRNLNPEQTCEQLMAVAKERGAEDNVTLIVARLATG